MSNIKDLRVAAQNLIDTLVPQGMGHIVSPAGNAVDRLIAVLGSTRKGDDHHTFVVVGSGEFPWDMLRYDACWPAHESGLGGSFALATPDSLADHRSLRYVELRTDWTGAPTVGRWKSFGWHVLDEYEMKEFRDRQRVRGAP